MLSFSYSYMLLDNKDKLAFDIASKLLKSCFVEFRDSLDSFDGTTCNLAIVTFRSECEWFAKHKLLAFNYAFDYLRNLPFPDAAIMDVMNEKDSEEDE